MEGTLLCIMLDAYGAMRISAFPLMGALYDVYSHSLVEARGEARLDVVVARADVRARHAQLVRLPRSTRRMKRGQGAIPRSKGRRGSGAVSGAEEGACRRPWADGATGGEGRGQLAPPGAVV